MITTTTIIITITIVNIITIIYNYYHPIHLFFSFFLQNINTTCTRCIAVATFNNIYHSLLIPKLLNPGIKYLLIFNHLIEDICPLTLFQIIFSYINISFPYFPFFNYISTHPSFIIIFHSKSIYKHFFKSSS